MVLNFKESSEFGLEVVRGVIFGNDFELLFNNDGAIFADLAIANIICENHGRIALNALIVVFNDDWHQIIH